jgi:hypothetical protein
MKMPYQIERIINLGHMTYRFELRHVPDQRLVDCVPNSKSPIAPRRLRDRQARLNTAVYLDGLLHGD